MGSGRGVGAVGGSDRGVGAVGGIGRGVGVVMVFLLFLPLIPNQFYFHHTKSRMQEIVRFGLNWKLTIIKKNFILKNNIANLNLMKLEKKRSLEFVGFFSGKFCHIFFFKRLF